MTESWVVASSEETRAEAARPSGRGGRGGRQGRASGRSRTAEGRGAAQLVAHQQTKKPREVIIRLRSGHRLHARLDIASAGGCTASLLPEYTPR